MKSFETLIYEKKGPLAYITLNRPEALNAVNTRMRDDFWQVLPALRDDPEVRVGIIRGAGERAFCAGADLTEFGTAPSQAIARRVRWERDWWGLLAYFSKPLVAAIHGFALGAGLEIALCCDLRVCSEDARFGLPEVGLGMIPAGIGTQTLPRQVRPGDSAELLLTGKIIDAPEAFRMGLVHRMVPGSQLMPAAEEVAQRVASLSPLATRYAKEAVLRGLDMALEEGLTLESELYALVRGTEDAREGVKAFLEGRPPVYRGD